MMISHRQWMRLVALIPSAFFIPSGQAQEAPSRVPATELRPFVVESSIGLHDEPALGLATPVTQLRYATGVDLQSRGYAELQSDVTVRGSVFEQAGVLVGTVPLFDPQTGHYAAELPFSGEMLQSPRLLQGADNAIRAFNANVASIAYQWAPIETRGKVIVGAGTESMRFGELYQGHRFGDSGWAIDLSLGHGEGDGTIENGDFDVWRGALRLQHLDEESQTDFAVGWLDKFYGWPGLYTGFSSLAETDDYQNLLVLLEHRKRFGNGSFWSVGAAFRQLDDDYYFNRFTLPADRSSLFQHLTRVGSLSGEVRWEVSDHWTWTGRTVLLADDLVRSTSLRNGDVSKGNDFTNRLYGKVAAVAEYAWVDRFRARQKFQFGLTGASTNRDTGRLSPLIRWEREVRVGDGDLSLLVEYAESTQVPGYTALRSSPTGLFGGNPNLGRELSHLGDIGVFWENPGWRVGGTVFFRNDDELVDWTYAKSSPTTRQANALDLATWGLELEASRRSEWGEVRLSYARLAKDADYGTAPVDASFYVLNFPIHRVTAGVRWRIFEGVEIASEGEFRVAEKNLRRTSGDEALLVSLALRWLPWAEHGLEFDLLVDNLFGSSFQEFPGTPAVGRHGSLRAIYRW